MSELSKEYKKILEDIEKNIQDPQQLTYVKNKIADVSILFMDIIDRMSMMNENKLKELENIQTQIESKMTHLENSVNEIESDIYEDGEDEDEEGYEFEIVCPYCNHEFVADIHTELKNEIECPDCHNMIELDWNDEPECGGNCSGCAEECYSKQETPTPAAKVAEDDIAYQKEQIPEQTDNVTPKKKPETYAQKQEEQSSTNPSTFEEDDMGEDYDDDDM